ncbi:hypothetical protein IEQ34_008129 [Dendrobium chrysotoxum]|uniref:NB-ARC domain-containing protein n=1 Tax=Dendrobium chrysotoxum TaxID=161865 RepID=A0AAV7H6Q5_DENCH|nr:hypothetical protein IEQ34_007850 [Dendrobium chrysotoxum]KAH0463547.1 hypothetical protein IEQ34_008129 [Dendrobium chrysotoxum]
MGHGGMRKTTLLQRVCGDEMTEEFDLERDFHISISFDDYWRDRSPLEAKVIGGVLKDNLDEKHWRAVLESNLLGQSSINSILRSSYKVLLNHLQNCFAFMLYVLTRSCF